MGYVQLYDYNNNHELTDVNMAYAGYQATISQQADSFIFQDNVYTKKIVTQGNYHAIEITGHGYINSDNYHLFMNAAGLGYIEYTFQADIRAWLEANSGQHRFGGNETQTIYPTIAGQYSTSNNFWQAQVSIAENAQSARTFSLSGQPHASYTTFGYASFIALDTRSEAEYGGFVFGLIGLNCVHSATNDDVIFELSWNNTINARTLSAGYSPDAGQKGFKPVGDRTRPNSPVGGGGRSGQVPPYTTDTIELPGEPNESYASAIGSGFINVYKVEESQLRKVGNILFDPDFDGRLKQLISNPIDCLISLNVFPCAPHTGSSEYIRGFGFNFKFEDDSDSATGHRLSKQFRTFDFGSVVIPEQWESYLDYDATSVTLFLPFIGEVDLPTAEVMGSSVNVTYTVDFLTGMCVANVGITKAVSIGDRSVSNKAVHSYQGNCAVNIPLTAVNYGAMVGSFINAANTGLRSGIAGGLSSLASDIVSGGFKPTVTTKGTLSANAGFCGVLYPYITINRPIPVECDNYQEVEGYPSYINNTIGSLQGLCVCDAIDLSGITGATASEIARLEQLCKEGVRN